MRTKIKNAIIIKDFDGDAFLGEIVICDGKIEFVGQNSSAQCQREIDAKGNIVMPGFVNCHAHCAMEVFKGLGGKKKLQQWLCDMQLLEAQLTSSDIYNATSFACLELAKNGITTVNDNYFFADYSAKAFADCGIRAVVSVSQQYSPKKFLTESALEQLYQKVCGTNPLITSNFYCHSIYNCSEKMFAVIDKLATKHGTFVSTHVSETLEEVGKCTALNDDLTPIALLEQYGFFDRKALAIHATNVDNFDIAILAKNKASVCANFASNFKLASGVCPIYQMTRAGINVCLGTDGSASNNRLDMFREMYLASTSQNILLSSANCLDARSILKMATQNGAKALGLDDVGTLNVGNRADLIILDAHGVDGAICNDIFENLVYSYGTEDVLLTMVDGNIVYENGKYHFKKSKNAILEKAVQIAKKFNQTSKLA